MGRVPRLRERVVVLGDPRLDLMGLGLERELCVYVPIAGEKNLKEEQEGRLYA